jgi:hypothetical protein
MPVIQIVCPVREAEIPGPKSQPRSWDSGVGSWQLIQGSGLLMRPMPGVTELLDELVVAKALIASRIPVAWKE